MDELEPLAKKLRGELGAPPDDWEARQRARLRSVKVGRRKTGYAARTLAGAAALGALALVFALWFAGSPSVKTDRGAPDTHLLLTPASAAPYRLVDGSQITLDPGASGRLTSAEASTRFELYAGRGHFDVAKKPGQNWSVVAGEYQVHVVGTRFSVSYTKANALTVAVDEGRVSVRIPERGEPVLLEAGDRLSTGQRPLLVERRRAQPEPRNPELGASQPGSTPAAREASARVEPSAQAKSSALGPSDQSALAGQPNPGAGLAPSQQAAPAAVSNEPGMATEAWHTLYRKGRYADALRSAQREGFAALTQQLDARHLTDLAETARLAGDSAAALAALTALERRFPGSAAAADAGFLIGRLHALRGESGPAITRFSTYLARGDGARYSLEALGRLMELEAARGNSKAARAAATRYLRAAPKGPYRHLADSILEPN